VLLPAGRLHDRGDRRPFGLAQQRNHGCLLEVARAVLVSTSINSLTCGPFGPWPIRTLTRVPQMFCGPMQNPQLRSSMAQGLYF
jgi:hypothetical protein